MPGCGRPCASNAASVMRARIERRLEAGDASTWLGKPPMHPTLEQRSLASLLVSSPSLNSPHSQCPLTPLFPSPSHFLLQFDTNPRVLSVLSTRFRADPRVIKWTTLKLGERLHEITPNVNASRLPSLDARKDVAGGERADGDKEGAGAVDRGQMGGRRTINAAQGY